MSPELIGVLGLILLLILFLLKIPVGIALLVVGLVGTGLIRGWDIALLQLGRTPFDTAFSYSLSVIPLFILMGMVLSYCGLGRDLYKAVDNWIGHVRGGLAMATIGTAAIFSAISGSVNATTATVAKITLPEMEKYNYKPTLSTACVAAGGTLGILIPPSVILILYGILTGENIGALLIAGIIPGILQIILFVITIAILIRRNPDLAPARAEKATMTKRFTSLKPVWPILALFIISVGGIYAGIFTPTEAAGVGAFGAFLFAFVTRRLTFKNLRDSLDDTVRLTAMIFLILIGANLFSQFLTISRIPVEVTNYVSGLDVSPYIILFLILVVLFILGLFIEGLSIFVLTLSILHPIVTSLGFDGVWFGVIMVMVVNIGLLTPPLGVSIFVIKGVAKDVPIQTIFRGVTPMVIAMIVCTAILIAFPQIVTFLPDLMRN
ncbi:TRAP transporter large permease [Evansella sp. LMS18]|jgi:tripartite ATP-independent transporter DctM subunit|uniref:TRAP transporter large permease n=1 Tax=Evansella sp. LMS18 TaxID=2924033 RepID=UPI0020D0BBDB|nr:TRAP transporter large permease [Evansella sp. LMS18]UTR08967.1 TRAP transporter large permease [Evansella sp. LMS18]